MANGMGSLYIGASGLQNSQNALNTTANNMANVDTKGYVRQQVLYADRIYTTFDKNSAISRQQAGLGVTIADVVHTRDLFLDKYYRTQSGRQAFYETFSTTVDEVTDLFQELEGDTYQQTLEDFWVSFEELSKQPDEGVKQNLVVQKATLFLEGAQKIYENTKSYQRNLNVQITDSVERINELGKKIHDLNKRIMAIEAGNVETAMSLRDERDNALDELGALVKIDYKETSEGIVKVKIEGIDFVNEARVHEIGLDRDPITEFLTPYWPHLSDEGKGRITNVFDYTQSVKSSNDTDVGKLKALVLARGDHVANYSDIEGLTSAEYSKGVKNSIIMNSQAELDQLIHTVVTTINDIFCPNKEVSFVGTDGKTYNNVLVWDEEKGCTGSDGVKPGHELFVRRGCERYTEVKGTDGKTYYVYNEEDPKDTSKQYTVGSILINDVLVQEESHLPHIRPNGEVNFEMAAELSAVWGRDKISLNPDDLDPCTIKEYYQRMINTLGSQGSVYSKQSTTLEGSVSSIDNKRQEVIGVASDEELTNMIKYQNAYNAASRYINVISEMLEHIIVQLGNR